MSVATPTAPAPRAGEDPPPRDRPAEPAGAAPPAPEPSQPGFWETVRAYVANEEPAVEQPAVRGDDRSRGGPVFVTNATAPSPRPASFRETVRAYIANEEPRPGH